MSSNALFVVSYVFWRIHARDMARITASSDIHTTMERPNLRRPSLRKIERNETRPAMHQTLSTRYDSVHIIAGASDMKFGKT